MNPREASIVEVHIEHLVLDGLDLSPSQAAALGESVRAVLARLVERHGLGALGAGAHGGAVARVQAPAIELPVRPTPADLGARVAHAIHGGPAS